MSDKARMDANGRRITFELEQLGTSSAKRAKEIGVGSVTYRMSVYGRTGNAAVIADLTALGIKHGLVPFDRRREAKRWKNRVTA
ncbi:hypothetical protein [Leptospira santarosai]|uniref:hypothetical protein n=2 Tax=Leptospira santarosai TaxID=28183 RepID=UPI0024AEA630|nr:hypothetical protein [Leptospira santarosai]MDI7183627.1 hypothetical protein [Leptospira santarosai]